VIESRAPSASELRDHRLSIQRARGSCVGRCGCGRWFRLRGSRGLARRIRDHHRAHVEEVLDYAVDLRVGCTICGRDAGLACLGVSSLRVHGTRRVHRLLAGLPLVRRGSGARA
jgi:hypothetical protein